MRVLAFIVPCRRRVALLNLVLGVLTVAGWAFSQQLQFMDSYSNCLLAFLDTLHGAALGHDLGG